MPPGASGPALEDASHFTCNAGACVWNRDCRSTAECAAATHTNQVACEEAEGEPVRDLRPDLHQGDRTRCSGSGKLGDVHHYACQAGRCRWLGCKSTLECTTALSSSKYVYE